MASGAAKLEPLGWPRCDNTQAVVNYFSAGSNSRYAQLSYSYSSQVLARFTRGTIASRVRFHLEQIMHPTPKYQGYGRIVIADMGQYHKAVMSDGPRRKTVIFRVASDARSEMARSRGPIVALWWKEKIGDKNEMLRCDEKDNQSSQYCKTSNPEVCVERFFLLPPIMLPATLSYPAARQTLLRSAA